jgi:hypothetical protein
MNSFEKITSMLKIFQCDVRNYYAANRIGTSFLIEAGCYFNYVNDISRYSLNEVNEDYLVCSDLARLFPEEKVNNFLTNREYGSFIFTRLESQVSERTPCALQLECTLDPDLIYHGRTLVDMAERHFAEFPYIKRRHCETFDLIFITDTCDLIIVTVEVQNYFGPDRCTQPLRYIGDLDEEPTENVEEDSTSDKE